MQDLDTGQLWTPTALPIRGSGTYIARHGFGYSRFQHEFSGIAAEMTQFVPLDAPAKIIRLSCATRDGDPDPRGHGLCRLGAGHVAGGKRTVHPDAHRSCDRGVLVQNSFSTAFPGRIAFADFGEGTTSLTADRAEFIGAGWGVLATPAGLRNDRLSGRPALPLTSAPLPRRPDARPGRDGHADLPDRPDRQRHKRQRSYPKPSCRRHRNASDGGQGSLGHASRHGSGPLARPARWTSF